MNYQEEDKSEGESSPVSDRALMALVDGELSQTGRRELLQQLDMRPGNDGWRRCALMFLEDQALRAAFAEPSRDAAGDLEIARALPVSDPSRNSARMLDGDLEKTQSPIIERRSERLGERRSDGGGSSPGQSLWILAAGLAAAFLFGMQFGGPWSVSDSNVGGQGRGPTAVPMAGGSMPAGQQGTGELFANTARQSDLEPGNLGLRNVGNQQDLDGASTIFVQDQNFWDRGGLVPHSVQQSFRNLGTEVELERGWMQVRTRDGRQFMVPYEEVNFVPVEQRSY